MYEFYYDYLKPKYGESIKLFDIDTDSYILHIKTKDFYKDIANDVDEWFDTSGYSKDGNKPLPIGKNKKVLAKFKDVSEDNIMVKHCAPRPKTYAHIFDDGKEVKKAKGVKKSVIKKDLRYETLKKAVIENETTMFIQFSFKSELDQVYTIKQNKKAVSPKDDKVLQAYDRVTTYLIGTPAVKASKLEMIAYEKTLPIKLQKILGKNMQNETNESEIGNDNTKNETNDSEINNDNTQNETNESKIDIDNTQNEIDEMGKDIINKLNGICKLKKDYSIMKNGMCRLKNYYTDIENKVYQLNDEYDDVYDKMYELEINGIQNKICKLKSDYVDTQNEICELKTYFDNMQNEACKLGDDYDNIQKEAQTLEIKCGDVKNMISRIKKDYDDIQEKIDDR